MKKIYRLLIFALFLVVVATAFYFIFVKQPQKTNYDFPKDYTQIDCLETFVGNVSGVCFISYDNNSIVLKQGDYYTAYSKKGDTYT
jgi:hypothetical protein